MLSPAPSLRQLDQDLWTLEAPLRLYGLRIGARMTLMRLPDGGLFVHSPVEPEADVRAEIDALGPVRHVAAPNKVHHLFVAACRRLWPDARFHAAPGLEKKKRGPRFDAVLDDYTSAPWSDAIEQKLCRGMPYLNEVAFLHRASGTLVLTDLAFNLQWGENRWTRLWMRAMGIHECFAVGRHVRLLVRDRPALRASIDAILAWNFDRVVVSHGVVLQRSGRRVLRQAFDWL